MAATHSAMCRPSYCSPSHVFHTYCAAQARPTCQCCVQACDPKQLGRLDYRALRVFLDEAGLQPTTTDVRHIMRELDPSRCLVAS